MLWSDCEWANWRCIQLGTMTWSWCQLPAEYFACHLITVATKCAWFSFWAISWIRATLSKGEAAQSRTCAVSQSTSFQLHIIFPVRLRPRPCWRYSWFFRVGRWNDLVGWLSTHLGCDWGPKLSLQSAQSLITVRRWFDRQKLFVLEVCCKTRASCLRWRPLLAIPLSREVIWKLRWQLGDLWLGNHYRWVRSEIRE